MQHRSDGGIKKIVFVDNRDHLRNTCFEYCPEDVMFSHMRLFNAYHVFSIPHRAVKPPDDLWRSDRRDSCTHLHVL